MATTARRGSSVKRHEKEAADAAVQVVRDQVEELARAGARQMLLAALEDEVNAYLQRGRYQRSGEQGGPGPAFRGYRNGTTPRRLTLGSGTVPLEVPRVRDIPRGQAAFESKLLRKYQRRSDTIDETFMRLFIEGLATRDFEPALRLLTGSEAPLIGDFLDKRGYRKQPHAAGKSLTDMEAGTYAFRMILPVGKARKVNIPIDVVIQPKKLRKDRLPILIEAKSAGDFTNTNKRRKEEATKIHQLQATYGPTVSFILFLCGYFGSDYLGYEAAEGIDWVWEHRIEDLVRLGL